MIDAKNYIEAVSSFFSFLEKEFGFKNIKKTINGNVFYDIRYQGSEKIISISYENIEDYLEVIIFLLQDGKMPHYDDEAKALHIQSLYNRLRSYISTEEYKINEKYFERYIAISLFEKKLLTYAKKLRLCLRLDLL